MADPCAEQVGYVLASSLERSWLGLDMTRQKMGVRLGDSGKELLGEVARSRALPRFVRPRGHVQAFERLHIDWSAGYVLDGELFEPARPYVVQVKQGPVAHFATL